MDNQVNSVGKEEIQIVNYDLRAINDALSCLDNIAVKGIESSKYITRIYEILANPIQFNNTEDNTSTED